MGYYGVTTINTRLGSQIKNMSRLFVDIDVDDFIRAFNEGKTQKEIGQMFGLTKKQVHNRCRALGLLRFRRIEFSDRQIAAMIELFQAGRGIGGIAKEFNVAANVVHRIFKERNIKPRNRSEQQYARMSNTTPEEKRRLVQAANAAMRGTVKTKQEIYKSNLGKFRGQSGNISEMEKVLNQMLRDRGQVTLTQLPIDKYNADIVVGDIAVEVFGGCWHWHGNHLAGSVERLYTFFDWGYHVVIVAMRHEREITPQLCDNLISLFEFIRSNKSSVRQYRMVRSDGQVVAAADSNRDDITIEWTHRIERNPTNGQYVSVPKDTAYMKGG